LGSYFGLISRVSVGHQHASERDPSLLPSQSSFRPHQPPVIKLMLSSARRRSAASQPARCRERSARSALEPNSRCRQGWDRRGPAFPRPAVRAHRGRLGALPVVRAPRAHTPVQGARPHRGQARARSRRARAGPCRGHGRGVRSVPPVVLD
jgi:hypothetical protein